MLTLFSFYSKTQIGKIYNFNKIVKISNFALETQIENKIDLLDRITHLILILTENQYRPI